MNLLFRLPCIKALFTVNTSIDNLMVCYSTLCCCHNYLGISAPQLYVVLWFVLFYVSIQIIKSSEFLSHKEGYCGATRARWSRMRLQATDSQRLLLNNLFFWHLHDSKNTALDACSKPGLFRLRGYVGHNIKCMMNGRWPQSVTDRLHTQSHFTHSFNKMQHPND